MSQKKSNHACFSLYEKSPKLSAKYSHVSFIVIFCSFLSLVFAFNSDTLLYTNLLLNIVFFISVTFRVVLFVYSLLSKSEVFIDNEIDWPTYTVLIPMFKEDKIVHQLVNAMNAIDYPSDKIKVKFIVEESDTGTIDALKKCGIKDFCCVPHSIPQTKPKACNYAFLGSDSDYIVIYDADDIPDPLQLKKAVTMFSEDPSLDCVQSFLCYYNFNHNWLTRLFELEYMSYFAFCLKGLSVLNLPIPLSGSSNHFRFSSLEKLGLWDPYNVTEDADLGFRMYLKNCKVGILQSYTKEEAPKSVVAWIKQRSRWIKGFIQTTIVHSRSANFSFRCILQSFVLYFFILFPVLSFIFAPFFYLSWFSLPKYLVYFSLFNLICGIFSSYCINSIIIYKTQSSHLFISLLIYPFYFILHSVSSYRACYQLLMKPWHWDKTDHGS